LAYEFQQLTPPKRLLFSEYIGKSAGGASEPIVVGAEDDAGGHYTLYLKLRNPGATGNHHGATSLACELICSVIARAVGLHVPNYAVVDVPLKDLMSPHLRMEQSVRGRLMQSSGLNFGTVEMAGYADLVVDLARPPADQISMENVMTFDGCVINDDRRQEKPNLLVGAQGLVLIDHSLTLAPAFLLLFGADTRFLTSVQVDNHPCRPHLREAPATYLHLCEALAAVLVSDNFSVLRSWIPVEWEQEVQHLDKIFDFLQRRHGELDQVAERLRVIQRLGGAN